MLSQEPHIISQILGFAGKQSWWLVSCKWKFGHTGERLPKGLRLGGGTPTRVFSRVPITSCWCQCKDPFEGSPPWTFESHPPSNPCPKRCCVHTTVFHDPGNEAGAQLQVDVPDVLIPAQDLQEQRWRWGPVCKMDRVKMAEGEGGVFFGN